MHPHTWPQDLIEAWGRSGFGVKNNWPLRYRPSSKRCQTRSCEDLPLYHRSHLCLHLEQRETAGSQWETLSSTARGLWEQWSTEHLSLSFLYLMLRYNFTSWRCSFQIKNLKSFNVALQNIVEESINRCCYKMICCVNNTDQCLSCLCLTLFIMLLFQRLITPVLCWPAVIAFFIL